MARLDHFRAMEAFEAVARTGSVSGAAAELGVSPGAISQQVRRLETHLGVSLLERRGRGLMLTRWGRLYHDELHAGLTRLRGAGDILDQARDSTALVVSGLPTLTAKWLGRALYDWMQESPEIPVRLIASEDEPDLDHGGVDLRMVFGTPPAGARAAEMFTDRVVPACAPGLLAGRSVAQPADLFQLPLLEINWSTRYRGLRAPDWVGWAEAHGIARPQRAPAALSFGLTATAIDAAAAGQGVVLGQVAMMSEELATGRLVLPFPLSVPIGAPYGLIWSGSALEKPGGARLRDWLVSRGRAEQAKLRAGDGSAGD